VLSIVTTDIVVRLHRNSKKFAMTLQMYVNATVKSTKLLALIGNN